MSTFYGEKTSSIIIVLTCFACFLITPSHSRTCFSYDWDIYIYNGIQDSTIDAHVKSKDNDLGHHNLTYDLGYTFGFCENYFENTLFWGDFTHGSQFVNFHVFDKAVISFIGGSTEHTNNVFWLLKQDGYYLSKEYKPYDDPAWTFWGHWQ
ncbi:hypothetical protein SSX86_011736 [Deinandra increscens subsp. villosa]|uniref:S-protein homolog n=1 Tax=Deinandra increscens subsp. villosa TaxID=3103831 RepID=A0AAP0D7E5_9ASTR